MFALESAMDEMAIACGLDPIEFRIRNEPEIDPESGLPFSSRNLVACLREGRPAVRVGGARPDPAGPARRRLARGHRGGRVDLSLLPDARQCRDDPRRRRRALHRADRRRRHRHRHLDGAHPDRRRRAGGRGRGLWNCGSGTPRCRSASVAGGSSGINGWGAAIVEAARVFRAAGHGEKCPPTGVEVTRPGCPTTPTTAELRDARLRGAVRRGAGARGHRRGARPAPARGVRRGHGSSTPRPPARSCSGG